MPSLDHARDARVAAYSAVSGREVHPVAEAALETPAARSLWHWWQSTAAAAGSVPERADFDIADYPSLATHLVLVEPMPEPGGGYRLRLAGEAFMEMFQRRKGHVWRRDGAPLDRAMAGYFDFLLEAGRPYRSTGRLACAWSDWFSFEALVCPLRDRGAGLLMGAAAVLQESDVAA